MKRNGLACLVLVCLMWPTTASAQSALQIPEPPVIRGWEVAVQVGGGVMTSPSGTATLPPPGNTISIGGANSTRQVSSWFFGDGTDILNANLARTLFGARMNSIDGMLTSTAEMGGGLSVNTTLTRRLTSRLAVEFGVSMAPESLHLSDSATSELQSATDSFENSFNSLMLLMAQVAPAIDAAFTVDEPSGMHVMVGGGVRFLLAHRGPTKPYVTAGFGVSSTTGGDIVTTVTGHYDFVRRITPFPRFQETDSVTIRHHADSSWYSSFGFGLTRDLGARYGIRAEIGVNLLSDPVHISIDAIPSSVITEPLGASTLSGNPGLIVSTVPGIPTNLSLEISDFETFSGDGLRIATRATAGVFFRF